ncbi:uncharacterized protein LOC114256063 [Camellia sinensis]|uniref:uncharacterized protein LOC114256063 n=1 Tax=Camellia sinensis TaxID=4442 RepID=UPI0010365DF5|nr:uncharacterized protein LOC114256063 [Camellia sinensis]
MAFITKRFKRFAKKKQGVRKFFRKDFNKDFQKGESHKKSEVTCYECNKLGHYKLECPELKKQFKKDKKKAMIVAWGEDSDDSDLEMDLCKNKVANLCLMELEDEVCFKSKSSNNQWYLDSACSRHMTGDRAMFSTLKSKEGGHVTFGDNSKRKIIGEGSIGKTSSPIIENVLLVEGLKHYLLNISQMCDKGNHVTFEKSHCTINNSAENKVLFVGYRHENFDVKSNEAVFLGYASFSKAYRVFDKRTLLVEESIHVAFDESSSFTSKNTASDDVVDSNPSIEGIYLSKNDESLASEPNIEVSIEDL